MLAKDEFYSIEFRKKLYAAIDDFQGDLHAWGHYFSWR